MKICKIYIKDFHQFQDFEMDWTNPNTGEPLEKICLIGGNGTGKTKLLGLIRDFLNKKPTQDSYFFCKIELSKGNDPIWAVTSSDKGTWYFSNQIEKIGNWKNKMATSAAPLGDWNKEFLVAAELIEKYDTDLSIYVPAESSMESIFVDVPTTNVNQSLELFDNFPICHEVSNNTITEFWKTLIYHLKKHDNDFRNFQNLEENQSRTVREVREMFDKQYPKILESLADLWNEILDKAGLEFDVAGASNPIQLTDNLKAYIKLKSTGQQVPYNELSTGIRNFIFKVGHIYSLYFNRAITSGILLIDEPENSLFPDFLYDLVGIYERIIQHTQIIMATHSPIIAVQFEPYERFVLEFDNKGHIQARRGTVPAGDDPNDILSKDFGVRSLLGKKGIEKWERYIELKTLIRLTKDMDEKSKMLDEFMTIGNEYNFSDALS
jgi:predicted ATP-dependent endonuclease of OLD family